MRVTRVYSDDRGETHLADLEIELSDAGEIGHLSQALPAKSIVFRTNKTDYDYDWHTAPARQFIVLLDGAIELEVSDGGRRVFRGGDVLLMEDISGRGHRTRNVELSERRSIFIELGPDTVIR